MASLSSALGLSPALAARIDKRVRGFVRVHKELFDPLLHATRFAAADQPFAVRMSRVLFENIDALWSEIRETGDLAVLLTRRARGVDLTSDEQKASNQGSAPRDFVRLHRAGGRLAQQF